MRRRQIYGALTAAAEAKPKDDTVPDKPPEKQPVKRPPTRRAAKPK